MLRFILHEKGRTPDPKPGIWPSDLIGFGYLNEHLFYLVFSISDYVYN